jgi:hypothetical protein
MSLFLPRADGGAFDFYSIGLAELPGGDAFGNPVNSGPFPLTFFGTREDGATVSDTVTVDSFLTLKTYNVSGFLDVVEVHWFQGAGPTEVPPSPTHQFGNLDVAPASFPEPSTLALVGLGTLSLFGWGWLRRTRLKSAAIDA